MKLLIVEDDETIRVGLRDYFEGEGYSVRVAIDGHESLGIHGVFKIHGL